MTLMQTPPLENLVHEDPFERIAALEAVGLSASPEELAEAAGRLLADPDPGVRDAAARHLTALGSHEAAERALPYIASTDITVRNLAGEVLTQIGAPAVPVLAGAVDDADKDVRKFAIDVLALLPAQALVGCIAARLDDPDANVRLAAVDALAALGAAEHADALRALYDREPLARPSIIMALGSFGGATDLAFFAQALADEDPVLQFATAEALAEIDRPDVLDLLLDKVATVDPMARPVMLASIVRLLEARPDQATGAPAEVETYLREMLADVDDTYVTAAIRGLRLLDVEATLDDALAAAGRSDRIDVELFTTLLAVTDPLGRLIDAWERGLLGADAAAQFVLGLLMQEALPLAGWAAAADFVAARYADLDADTKIAAVSLSHRLGHPALVAIVAAGLRDPDPSARTFAQDAARDLGCSPTV